MASNHFDPQPPERSGAGKMNSSVTSEVMDDDAGEEIVDDMPSDGDLLAVISRAQEISGSYQTRTVDRSLARSYRAWQNQHAEGSKYLGAGFKGRSRLFVPKTRSAVRKNLATAAGALFSTEDVTNISATYEDDPQQRATAATIKADLEYRMTRAGTKSGMPWFLLAMGACLDAQLTGICVSKQYWDFHEVDTRRDRIVKVPVVNPMTGQPFIGDDGQPVTVEKREPIFQTVRDRPMVELHPIENAGFDPAAPWHSPVQSGRWFFMRYPMGIDDAKAMLKGASKTGENYWRDVPNSLLLKGRIEDNRTGARRTREGGGDRYEDAGRAGGGLDIIWLQENFVRVDGADWHFWSVAQHGIISEVRPTIEAYPEFGGERPYVMGVSQLDTHRIFPQSPVETWQPLQNEINDVTNLRLDTLKRSIAPLTLAKRGKSVDLQALQRRGQPETIVLLDSMDDVQIVPTPAPNGAAFQETSVTNANFDELAGVFSTSSVQTSRQLNETVGGMSLMSRAATSVSDFDLRVWIETWVEPVIRQLVHLIRYYETDEKMVAIAGQQARAWSKFEYMPNVDDFEQCELTIRVNAGIGSVDPVQKLQKLKFAMEMIAPLMEGAASQGITVNYETVIEEIMGNAGFRDGRRFFEKNEAPDQSQPPPELMLKFKELELKNQRLEAEREKWMREIEVKLEAIRSGERQSAADNEADISAAEIEWTGRLAQHTMGQAGSAMMATNQLRSRENASAQNYRMSQLGNRPDPTQQSGNVETSAKSAQISDLVETLIRQVSVLAEKVAAQDAMLDGIFGQQQQAMPQLQ